MQEHVQPLLVGLPRYPHLHHVVHALAQLVLALIFEEDLFVFHNYFMVKQIVVMVMKLPLLLSLHF
jgi:hypothetical protein